MIDVIADRIVRKNPFLRDWSNYGIIDIFNPVATAQYQHSVTIASKSGMMHDFRDLRFFQADGTEIPFWVESKTDGSTSFVWFKPYSPSLKNVYCFYGNREAVSQSNGDRVFELFDDFLGSSLDATKWETSGSTQSVSSSILSLAYSGGNSVAAIKTLTWGVGYSTRFRASFTRAYYTSIGWGALATGGAHISYYGNYSFANKFYAISDSTGAGTSKTDTYAGDTNLDGYQTWEIARYGSTNSKWWINNDYLATHSTNVVNTSLPVRFWCQQSGSTIAVDWVLVRKYTATEPVCQLNQSGLRNPAYR